MKKVIHIFQLMLVIALMIPINAFAKVVTPSEAKKVVSDFLYQGVKNGTQKQEVKNAPITLLWDSKAISGPSTRSSNDEPSFYVYEINDGKGFVIVSAEDAIEPILGYSFENKMGNPSEMPDNFKFWLNQIVHSVEQVRSQNIQPTEEVQKAWETPAPEAVSLYFETAEWDQFYPYNLDCPVMNGRRTLTGCVATATAIVMRYHKCPKKGIGYSDAFYTRDGLRVEERNLEHEYNWEKMPLHADMYQSYTQEESKEVARLMADVGSVYQLNYGLRVTSGYMTGIYDIANKFKYTSPTYTMQYYYTDDQWETLIRNEMIISGGPLIYGGESANATMGHAFVLDGCTVSRSFHVNWGWSSYGNGYYSLKYMHVNGNDFSYRQDMIVNFHPKETTYSPVSFKYDEKTEMVTIQYDDRLYHEVLLDGKSLTDGVDYYYHALHIQLDKATEGQKYEVRLKTLKGEVIKEFSFDVKKIGD